MVVWRRHEWTFCSAETRHPSPPPHCSLHLAEATSYMNTHEQAGALPAAPLPAALCLLCIHLTRHASLLLVHSSDLYILKQ